MIQFFLCVLLLQGTCYTLCITLSYFMLTYRISRFKFELSSLCLPYRLALFRLVSICSYHKNKMCSPPISQKPMKSQRINKQTQKMKEINIRARAHLWKSICLFSSNLVCFTREFNSLPWIIYCFLGKFVFNDDFRSWRLVIHTF